MDTLTDRQREVLEVVYRIRTHTGRSPTFAELRDALLCNSNNAIADHLDTLERKGAVVRELLDEQGPDGRWVMREIDVTDTGRAQVRPQVRDWNCRAVLTAEAHRQVTVGDMVDIVHAVARSWSETRVATVATLLDVCGSLPENIRADILDALARRIRR